MKKFIITALLAAMPFITFAQAAFDKFQDQEGIDGIVLNENVVNILNYIKLSQGSKQVQPYLQNLKDVESLRIFTTSEKKYAKDMKKTVATYLRKHNMEELVTLNSDGTKVKVYMVAGTDPSEINELLVFTENKKDNNTTLISFIGNIDLDQEQKTK
ncbi:DUF4252 domain-containing protein [Flavobacterium litorale]|uniref:DUF4252 domain-containing protein n=1 Tax=Flavobacterium litorale TaxID=2856519 RepID=A0ABX8V5R5_9FLAO|nr:DUF4252 domain-containing protein [Flavobacterium litorale]QYJ68179.1 DUF4252 domain-containing protein [Flavobacterium litorale]